MGYPYHELVVPAILFDNPGLTKEELARERDQVLTSSIVPFKETDAWNSHQEIGGWERIGLERIAAEMRIGLSQKFTRKEKDGNGVLVEPVAYEYLTSVGKELIENPFRVTIQTSSVLRRTRQFRLREYDQDPNHKIGDFLQGDHPEHGILIREIVNKKQVPARKTRQSVWDGDVYGDWRKGSAHTLYVVKATEVDRNFATEDFPNEREMFLAWPELRPETRFDFEQKSGGFRILFEFGDTLFCWKMVDGKYYLDPATFDKIPVSFLSCWRQRNGSAHNLGYTDLILTAEAIKHHAWKLLSHRGLDNLDQFLKDFPDSKARYEQAVIDAETSWNAKSRGKTHTELLRMRLRADTIS
jgi:hypothetical protein